VHDHLPPPLEEAVELLADGERRADDGDLELRGSSVP
jgi:hypothetical protein